MPRISKQTKEKQKSDSLIRRGFALADSLLAEGFSETDAQLITRLCFRIIKHRMGQRIAKIMLDDEQQPDDTKTGRNEDKENGK